jgi:hypothetical protein
VTQVNLYGTSFHENAGAHGAEFFSRGEVGAEDGKCDEESEDEMEVRES